MGNGILNTFPMNHQSLYLQVVFNMPDFVLGVQGTQPVDTCLCSQVKEN